MGRTTDTRTPAQVLADTRAAKARYAREWRRRNPDKQRAIMNRYWAKKVEQQREQQPSGDE